MTIIRDLTTSQAEFQECEAHDLLVDNNLFVGIEIEIEDSTAFDFNPWWHTVNEDSIEGYEIVLRNPLQGSQLVEALQMLDPFEFSQNAFNPRTSVHVHLNIQDMTVPQLCNFIILYLVFESVLYEYIEEHRRFNHFCLPLSQNYSTIDRLQGIFRNTNPEAFMSSFRSAFPQQTSKYAGLNLAAVRQYGSLEFRMHQGTSSSSDIIKWVNILSRLKAYAMNDDQLPETLINTKCTQGELTFFYNVFQDEAKHLLCEDLQEKIIKGSRLATEVVEVADVYHGETANELAEFSNKLRGES